jgi:hypothetical protein
VQYICNTAIYTNTNLSASKDTRNVPEKIPLTEKYAELKINSLSSFIMRRGENP